MINKAQTLFISRGNLDSREYSTWYDNEDVQHLVYQIYRSIPSTKKQFFAKPYVFFDNVEKNEATTLDKLLGVCHQSLREDNLPFLPFILKPR